MITCDDHDGVIQLTCGFEHRNGTSDVLVKGFDLNQIIKNVISDNVVIRKYGWHYDLAWIFSYSLSGSQFIGPMWFGGPQPETKRLII